MSLFRFIAVVKCCILPYPNHRARRQCTVLEQNFLLRLRRSRPARRAARPPVWECPRSAAPCIRPTVCSQVHPSARSQCAPDRRSKACSKKIWAPPAFLPCLLPFTGRGPASPRPRTIIHRATRLNFTRPPCCYRRKVCRAAQGVAPSAKP